MVYSPQLFIGVQHTPDQLPGVISLLEKIIKPGIIVGTEACQYPVTPDSTSKEIHRPAFCDFYNSLGAYVNFHGGRVVPLDDHINCIRHIEELTMASEVGLDIYTFERELLRKAGIAKDFLTGEIIRGNMMKLLFFDRGFYGTNCNPLLGDLTALKLMEEHQPHVVVFGLGHIGAFYSRYASADVKIVCPDILDL